MSPSDRRGTLLRLGVVLPVHDEEEALLPALRGLERAMGAVTDHGIACRLVVVLDDCSDSSPDVVHQWCATSPVSTTVEAVAIRARNVGQARRPGCAVLLDRWSDVPPERVWLATTDADSVVPADWLAAQVRARSAGAGLWTGRVQVRSWDGRDAGVATEWHRRDADERHPVHGANFGIDAAVYRRTGGFAGLATGEDRDLAYRALLDGAPVRADASVRVETSARRRARAPQGFGHALSQIERGLDLTEVVS